jgi:hypothetical protein
VITRLIVSMLALVVSSMAETITMTWTPPTNNIDGTPITDSLTYRIYYWSTSSFNSIDTTDTFHSLLLLYDNEDYHFAVAALNSNYISSELSDVYILRRYNGNIALSLTGSRITGTSGTNWNKLIDGITMHGIKHETIAVEFG